MSTSGHVDQGKAILRRPFHLEHDAAAMALDHDAAAIALDHDAAAIAPFAQGGDGAAGRTGDRGTAMRQRAQVRVELSAREDGHVTAVFRGRAAASLPALAVMLDGVLHQVVQPAPGKRGAYAASLQLPPHLLFASLDLLTLPACESLLPLPWRLDAVYGLQPSGMRLDGMAVAGGFTALPWLADVIGVELLDGGGLAGQGIAARVPDTASWQFHVPLANVAPPGRGVQLLVRVGGRVLDTAPIEIEANALGLLGCLDVATPTRVEGWAMRTTAAREPVQLEVMIGSEVVGTVRADRKRADISASEGGVGGALCGFEFELPKPADPRAAKRISVRVAGTRTGLTGSPVVIDPMPALMGRFDTLHGMSAHGWALNRAHPDRKVMVEAIGPGGEILGAGPATHFRGDLLGAGLADGLCAFKIDISAHYERLIGQDIAVRFAGTNVLVAGLTDCASCRTATCSGSCAAATC